MNITKIGNTIRDQIHIFPGKLSLRFSKPTSKFVEQMVYGITSESIISKPKQERS